MIELTKLSEDRLHLTTDSHGELENLREKLIDAEKRLHESTAECEKMQNLISTFEEELRDSQTTVFDTTAELQATKIALEESKVELTRLLEDSSRSSAHTQFEVDSLKNRISELEQELNISISEKDSIRSSLISTEEELDSVRSLLSSKEDEVDSLRSLLSSTEEELDSVRSSLTSKEDELYSVRNSLTSKEDELYSLRNSLTSKEDELYSVRSSLTSKEDELYSLRNSLTSKEDELYSLRSLLSSTDGELRDTQILLEDKQRQLDHSSDSHMRYAELRAQLAETEDELKKQRLHNMDLNASVSSLEENLAHAQSSWENERILLQR